MHDGGARRASLCARRMLIGAVEVFAVVIAPLDINAGDTLTINFEQSEYTDVSFREQLASSRDVREKP